MALAPATVFATANDAWFAGVAGWATALLVLASARRDRWGDVEAVGGGLLAGFACYLTYPAGLFLLPIPAVALLRRRARPLVVGALGIALVETTVTASGFSWLAGLSETRAQYSVSAAQFRPYWYFVFADVAILARDPAGLAEAKASVAATAAGRVETFQCDVAKAESGQLHVDPANVDLAALFGRLRGLARPMAGDKPVARETLLNEVWGYNSMPSTRTVDVHVAWLRQKLEDNPRHPQFIITVHGLGYKFVA